MEVIIMIIIFVTVFVLIWSRKHSYYGKGRHIETISEPANLSATSKMLALLHVPFIDKVNVHMYTCDHRGTTLSIHDTQVFIPPGALPDGVIVHIEMGVVLHGPYKFPDGYQPVSPILWFCIKEDVELLIPVVYTLPHVITDIDSVTITFVKANHQIHKNHYDFEVLPRADMDFNNTGYGSLTSKHSCFLCIVAGKSSKVTNCLALKKGYFIHLLTERINSSSYRILFICTYFLKTCFEVSTQYATYDSYVRCIVLHMQALRMMYPKDEYEHFRTINFHFASFEEHKSWLRRWKHQREPCLLIKQVETSSPNSLARIEVKRKVQNVSLCCPN
jgi:hypothetical protein